MITTLETRLRVTPDESSVIDECIDHLSWAYRTMWSLLNRQQKTEKEIYDHMMGLGTITCHQVKSLIYKIKADRNRLREITKTQLKQYESRLEHVTTFIGKETKKISSHTKQIIKLKAAKKIDYTKIASLTTSVSNKERLIKNKHIKVRRLQNQIQLFENRLNTNTFKFCFGSSSLLKRRPGHPSDKFRLTASQKPYASVKEWQEDWELARNNCWVSVGDKSQPQGNPEILYNAVTQSLRLRLTEKTTLRRLTQHAHEQKIDIGLLKTKPKLSRFRTDSKHLTLSNVVFCPKHQAMFERAVQNKQPITVKIMKRRAPHSKEIAYYAQISFLEVITPTLYPINGYTLGVDLNQKGLAYCVVKPDGNKLSGRKGAGFISWDLKNKSSEQRQWLISNATTELLKRAEALGVSSIAFENLDFTSKIDQLNSGYKSNPEYSKMLTEFANSQFKELLLRKTERKSFTVSIVNPLYSSAGGYAKFGLLNKLPVDIAASLWLARQALLGTSYKTEGHITFIKKYNETTSLPYGRLSKQSKRLARPKDQWKDVFSALGPIRKQWYVHTLQFIRSRVDLALLAPDVDPFDPLGLNLTQNV